MIRRQLALLLMLLLAGCQNTKETLGREVELTKGKPELCLKRPTKPVCLKKKRKGVVLEFRW